MKKSKSSGFVLIEALISMMVFAVGFLGVAKMQVAVVEASADAKTRAEAITLAQARMDEMRLIASFAEHTGSSCGQGTVVRSNTSAGITGINAVYTITSTVNTSCNPARHQILVDVAWQDARGTNRNVALNSVIAWKDPARNLARAADGNTVGGGGAGLPTNVRLGDMTADYTAVPDGARANGKDGSFINYNADTGEYEVLVPVSGGFRVALYSNVPVVRISGLVVLDNNPSTSPTGVTLASLAVYRTDITFCLFPLTFTDENDPNTYGGLVGDTTAVGVSSGASDRAGAYVCYVPEGWAGNVGLLEYGSNNVCPEDTVSNVNFVGTRTHRVHILSGTNIVGQSGVLLGHQNMVMPNYPALNRLDRLDLLVTRFVTSGNSAGRVISCKNRFIRNSGQTAIAAPSGNIVNNSVNVPYSAILRDGAPDSRADGTFDVGVPSITYSRYVVDAYNLGVDGGFELVTGTYTGSACPTLGGAVDIRAFNGSANYRCTASGGSYSCSVGQGWSGSVGYWTGTTVAGGGAVTAVTAPTTGPAVTCP